jgi:hypothetical protein
MAEALDQESGYHPPGACNILCRVKFLSADFRREPFGVYQPHTR